MRKAPKQFVPPEELVERREAIKTTWSEAERETRFAGPGRVPVVLQPMTMLWG